MIIIRNYQEADAPILRKLFVSSVRRVAIRDYSQAQVEAWAPQAYDKQAWDSKMAQNRPFVAILNDRIVGYADLQSSGYIDHFYCHWRQQGQGVGTSLMQFIIEDSQRQNIPRIYSDVSITAMPFFKRFDFEIVSEQTVSVRGQTLKNYNMERTSPKHQ